MVIEADDGVRPARRHRAFLTITTGMNSSVFPAS
jgi:hypothetical protein